MLAPLAPLNDSSNLGCMPVMLCLIFGKAVKDPVRDDEFILKELNSPEEDWGYADGLGVSSDV